MTTSVTVELTGPFFQRDPGKTLRGNTERMMQGLAEEGERTASDAFRATEDSREPIALLRDRVAAHVVGRVKSVTGKRWYASAVVSINNVGWSADQGKSLMAAASEAERETHVMRNLARSVRSSRAVLLTDLAAGLE